MRWRQSYIDRIEKAGPVRLEEARTAEEARLIIAKRLVQDGADGGLTDPSLYFGPQFFEEFSGLSTRRIWSWRKRGCASRKGMAPRQSPRKRAASSRRWPRRWVSAARTRQTRPRTPKRSTSASCGSGSRPSRKRRSRPTTRGLLDVLSGALALAREEWGRAVDLTLKRPEVAEDLPTVDVALRHQTGFAAEARVFLCNRPTQGGGFKRQLDRALPAMMGKNCFMLRASDFPPNKKNQTAQAFRKFREGGGRSILVPITDWERMMMVREFHAQHRQDPGFGDWFEHAKLLSDIPRWCRCCGSTLSAATRPAGKPDAVAAGEAPKGAPAPAPEPERERAAAIRPARRGGRCRRQHPGRPRPALQQEHHAQQGRLEAPRRGARRLGLRQDDAGAVHHRAVAAEGHPGGADRPQGRSVLLR
jgi:hypothetical protein